MKKRLFILLQYLFFLALGIFLVWWSIKDIDSEKMAEIRSALKNARLYLIAPVFIILIASHYVRALRWRLLMEPLGYKPDKTNTFFAVMIGYLANQAFPRLGEVLKCTLLARYEKIPADKLVGTIILERLIDAICLLLVFAITLLIQPGLYSQIMATIFNKPGEDETPAIPGYVFIFIIVGIISITIGLWMLIRRKNFNDLAAALKKIGSRVWQGLSTIRHLKKRKTFLVLTLLIWGLYLSGGYIGFQALHETELYGIREAFTILSAGSIGMIVTPGGIGAYAYLIEATMQMYGLQQSIAIAFGWLLWLAQTVVILVGGLISFGLLPGYNKRIRSRIAGSRESVVNSR
ncbi:MAG TPA: lysylphosphatidylglycerol synthase transmembrane domain-containing protein [Chitinophagaceae bacterium]|nr:lysylphosphatidylglycerol synthase transmembrane domain-containing protein [Chitinophagaceae bacterium]